MSLKPATRASQAFCLEFFKARLNFRALGLAKFAFVTKTACNGELKQKPLSPQALNSRFFNLSLYKFARNLPCR